MLKIILVILILCILIVFLLINHYGYINYLKMPKNIFFFWDKGYDDLPDIGKICVQSWKKLNPEYRIIFLNKSNIYDFLDKELLEEIWTKNQIQTQSDLIRINLLKKHGGIWIDMTVYCSVPLKKWLSYKMKSGLFLFKYRCNDCNDLGLASWFIACNKNNYIIEEICEKYNKFWEKNTKSIYFNFHVIAKNTIRLNPKCLDIYRRIPYFNGQLGRMNLYGVSYTSLYLPINYNIKYILDRNDIPVFKFNWNHRDAGQSDENSINLYKKYKKYFNIIPPQSTLIYYLKNRVETF